jgi:hypothetical protein
MHTDSFGRVVVPQKLSTIKNHPVMVMPMMNQQILSKLGINGLGTSLMEKPQETSLLTKAYIASSWVGALSGAYHGYLRNKSAGWAFGWFLAGGIVPFFTIPLSYAQGFGKEKVEK